VYLIQDLGLGQKAGLGDLACQCAHPNSWLLREPILT